MNKKSIKKELAKQAGQATWGQVSPRTYQGYQFSVAKDRGDLIERLQTEAAKQKRSVSWLICEACEQYLKEA